MRKKIRGITAILFTTLFLSGCGPTAMRYAFTDYGDVYAETQNRQLLLNLARLSQHHPTYFFQMGNIVANFEFTGSINAQGTEQNGTPPYRWLWSSISGTGTRSSKPQFNFVPLNGGESAAHLITPLRGDTFNALFREGFPVDVLMRSLVQQVRYTVEGTTNEFILHNVPSIENKTNYATFLRVCGILRELQDRGFLTYRLVSQTERIPGGESDKAPNDKQVEDAMAKDLKWQKDTNGWFLERESSNSLSFQLTGDAETYLDGLKTNTSSYFKGDHPGELIDNIKLVLGNHPASDADSGIRSQVEFRSFLFVLAGMAEEQAAFRILCHDKDFAALVPETQLRPVLKMDWDDSDDPPPQLGPALVKVTYLGRLYEIADPRPPRTRYSRRDTANRDAFMLASILFTQISLDPSKINYLPQLLQVR